LGRDNVFIIHNNSGGSIAKGAAVYVTGYSGSIPNVSLAKADSLTTLPVVGLAVDIIANGANGFIMKLGILSGVDTSAFSPNDEVWVSTTVAGALTNVRPSGTSGAYAERVGAVLISGVGGQLDTTIAPFIGNMENGTTAATWTGNAVVGSLFTGPVTALKSATTSVDVSAAAAPSNGKVLTATGSTAATWQTPAASPYNMVLAQIFT
jgi:hypothetical protein